MPEPSPDTRADRGSPVSVEEIEQLRQRARHCTTHHEACDCRELAHAEEVERLLAHIAELREIAGEMAGRAHDHELRCIWCFMRMYDAPDFASHHSARCPVTKYRALLADADPR